MSKYIERDFWLFYVQCEDGVYGTNQHELYAFTDDKKLAKAFKATRNMKVFTCEKEMLDRKLYNSLIKGYITAELRLGELTVRTSNENKACKVYLPITTREQNTINSTVQSMLYERIYTLAWYDPEIISHKYQKALKELLYTNTHNHLEGDNNAMSKNIEKMKVDTFSILMDNFKKTFI